MKEYIFSETVFKKDVAITLMPTDSTDFSDFQLNPNRGTQRVAIHRKADLAAAREMVCHTIAHAPNSLKAKMIPIAPEITSPKEFDAAILATVICFINLFV